MGKLELIMESDSVSIYSPKHDGETLCEFEKFLAINKSLTHSQLKVYFDAILSTIEKIEECGARENLFRLEGGRVKAIPLLVNISRIDRSVGKIRLYCLRYSDRILVIGNGGISTERCYDNDPILLSYVEELRNIDKLIVTITRQAGITFEDFDAMSDILKSISY